MRKSLWRLIISLINSQLMMELLLATTLSQGVLRYAEASFDLVVSSKPFL